MKPGMPCGGKYKPSNFAMQCNLYASDVNARTRRVLMHKVALLVQDGTDCLFQVECKQ